jgi:hypothetical protein
MLREADPDDSENSFRFDTATQRAFWQNAIDIKRNIIPSGVEYSAPGCGSEDSSHIASIDSGSARVDSTNSDSASVEAVVVQIGTRVADLGIGSDSEFTTLRMRSRWCKARCPPTNGISTVACDAKHDDDDANSTGSVACPVLNCVAAACRSSIEEGQTETKCGSAIDGPIEPLGQKSGGKEEKQRGEHGESDARCIAVAFFSEDDVRAIVNEVCRHVQPHQSSNGWGRGGKGRESNETEAAPAGIPRTCQQLGSVARVAGKGAETSDVGRASPQQCGNVFPVASEGCTKQGQTFTFYSSCTGQGQTFCSSSLEDGQQGVVEARRDSKGRRPEEQQSGVEERYSSSLEDGQQGSSATVVWCRPEAWWLCIPQGARAPASEGTTQQPWEEQQKVEGGEVAEECCDFGERGGVVAARRSFKGRQLEDGQQGAVEERRDSKERHPEEQQSGVEERYESTPTIRRSGATQPKEAQAASLYNTEGVESPWIGVREDTSRVAGAVALSAQPLDDIARATLQVEQQTERVRRSSAVKAPPLVSMAICSQQAQTKLKALKCSLVTQVSGYPEGCECRVKAKKCPGVDKSLGFTGVSPSIAFSPLQLNGASVILCMYWQWLKPQDRRMEEYYAVQEAKDLATDLVKTANFNAEVGAKAIATPLYGMTPPPLTFTTTYGIPPTPMPIYEPVLFMSTTGFIPFFGNFGPAPGPSAFAYGISFTIRINSINYAMLAANPALTMAFEEILKRSIAQQAGVQPFHVSMRLGAGSVIVQVFISPASGVPDMVIVNKLSTSPTFLGVLTNFVNTVPGILAYAIGPITINWISMPSVGLAPWIEAGPSPGPAPGGFLSPFMPFGLSLVPGPAPGPAGPAPAPAPAR